MLTTLLILCVSIWLLILVHQITRRGFLVLLIWLCMLPVVTNLVNGHTNPFFETPQVRVTRAPQAGRSPSDKFKVGGAKLNLETVLERRNFLFEPTRILIGIFLVVFLLDAVRKGKRLVSLDGTETWMIIFSLLLVASMLLQSKRQALALRVAVDAFMVPFLAYAIARRLVTEEDRFRQLVQVLGYFGFFVILICITERLVHTEVLHRLRGPFENQIRLQVFLATVFFALLAEQQTIRTIRRSVRLFVLYLSPVVILLLWQRASWVGFLSGISVFVFLGHRLSNSRRKLHQVGIVLILLPVVILGVQILMSDNSIEHRITGQGTPKWRLLRWQVALREGIEHPFFGIGLTNVQDTLGNADLNYSSAHSSFVTLFAEQGVLGLLVYLAIVTSITRKGWSLYRMHVNPQDKWRGVAIIAIWAAHHMPSLFYDDLHTGAPSKIYMYAFIGGIMGLSRRYPLASVPYVFSRSHEPIHTT